MLKHASITIKHMNYYILALMQFSNFRGKSSSKAYSMFIIFHLLIIFILSFLGGYFGSAINIGLVYGLLTLIPYIAIGVRRFRDIGKSPWWVLLLFIPFIGYLVPLGLCFYPSVKSE